MAATGVPDLTNVIQVVVAETVLTARLKTVVRQLVRVMQYPENKGSPISRPKLGKLTASTLVDGQDIATPQTLMDSSVNITPLEVGVQTVLTDRMISRAPAGFEALVAEEHARAYAVKLDTDLASLFSGFGVGLSASGSAITVNNCGAARMRIKGNTEPGPDPVFLVLHPYQAWKVYSGLYTTTSGYISGGSVFGISAEVLETSGIGKLFNMMVFEDGYTPVGTLSTDMYGAAFSKEGIMLFVVDEGSMRPQRDESLRATELNFVGEYGYGEWVDTYNYYLLTDATAPTS